MPVVHELDSELAEIDFFERGKNMGEFIGQLHANRPLSSNPRVDALEDGAIAFGALSGGCETADEVGSLVRGLVRGIESRFEETGVAHV